METSGIYCWLNIENGNRYVGQSQTVHSRFRHHRSELRGNRHCNAHLQNAWNKHGERAFVFQILEDEIERKRLDERERFWIAYYHSTQRYCGYNLEGGGFGGKVVSPESIEKGAAKARGKKHSPEWCAKISAANKGQGAGRKVPRDIVERVRLKQIGRKCTEATKARLREILKNHRPTPETIEKARLANINRVHPPLSAEHKAKISASHMGVGKGRKHSDATRLKMREAQRICKPRTPEHRAKIAEANRKRNIDGAFGRHMSLLLTGRVFSDETKAKMRASRRAYFDRLAQEKANALMASRVEADK